MRMASASFSSPLRRASLCEKLPVDVQVQVLEYTKNHLHSASGFRLEAQHGIHGNLCGAPVGKRKFLSKEHYLSWMEREDEPRTKEQKAEERAVEEQRVQMNTIPVKDHGSEEQQRGLNEEEERKYIRENWVIRLFMIILLITGVFLVNQTAS